MLWSQTKTLKNKQQKVVYHDGKNQKWIGIRSIANQG